MPPRVLILSSSVGAGHVRAAEAVEAALGRVRPDAVVKNVDVLRTTNRLFKFFYGDAYLHLVNRAPHVVSFFYDLLDRPKSAARDREDKLRQLWQKANLKRLRRLLCDEPWDLIINTHFLSAEIVASFRRAGRIDVPQVTVTTDYETHRMWVNQPCERYFTATAEGSLTLQALGVPAADIFQTGIPVHPLFAEPRDPRALLAKYELSADLPRVLLMAGGHGVGPVEQQFQALLTLDTPTQILAVTGRNEKLKATLESVPVPPRHRARIFGFTKEIDELMALATLVVSKPGGLTTSEVLARHAVMVMVNVVPGQESRNADYLLENGAAIKVNNIAALAHKVESALRDPDRLELLRANVRRIARPRAAFDVVERSLELIPACR
jgi:processive 1,2-diacylglycerol beta-glucosyltransferase